MNYYSNKDHIRKKVLKIVWNKIFVLYLNYMSHFAAFAKCCYVTQTGEKHGQAFKDTVTLADF